MIGLFGSGESKLGVRNINFRDSSTGLNNMNVGVLYEIQQLASLELVVSKDGTAILGVADIVPAQLGLQGTGAQIYNLLQPASVDREDKAFFFEAFPPLA